MNLIKIFHPEETVIYPIQKGLIKLVWQNKGYVLMIELASSEELDLVEEGSLRDSVPSVVLSIEDFPVEVDSIEQFGKTPIYIEKSLYVDDNHVDIYYSLLTTHLDEDFELNENELKISQINDKIPVLQWKGLCEDFLTKTDKFIPFEVYFEQEKDSITNDSIV